MTTELEKTFFDMFGIEIKRNHEVMLEAISGGVKSANFSQKTFYEYPKIADRHYLELICILTRNCYQIEIYNALTYQGINEFTINLIKEPTRYHSHSEDFKIALLKAIKMISDDEDIKTEVQAIFEEER